jgi:hypothetical protein
MLFTGKGFSIHVADFLSDIYNTKTVSIKTFNCMRTLLFLSALLFSLVAFSAVNPTPAPRKASDLLLPVGNTMVSLEDLATMKPAAFAKLTGKKMKLGDRIGFWLTQKKLRRCIMADGTVNTEKLKAVNMIDPAAKFHIGGFLLGVILGIIGVLIAYLINDDKKLARTRWAWIGFAASIVIILLVIL